MSGNDPLVVEDWSAYEKSMLDVLREERQARLNIAVERILSPERSRRFVQRKTVELEPVEPPVSDAPPHPVVLQFPPEPVEQGSVSAGMEHEAPERGAVPQTDPSAASWWRIPVILSSLAVAVAGGAVAIVKPDRDASRAPAAAVSQKPPVRMDAGAALSTKDASSAVSANDAGAVASTIPAPASEPGGSEYVVSGDRVRLRSAAGVDAPVLRTLRQGTAVTIKERSARNEWCRVEAAGGYAGWMKCDFLARRPPAGADPTLR